MTNTTNYPERDTHQFADAVPRQVYVRQRCTGRGPRGTYHFQHEDKDGRVVALLAWDTRSERPAPTKEEAHKGAGRYCMLAYGLFHGRVSSYRAALGGVIYEVELFNHDLFEQITRRPGHSADPQRQIRDARGCLRLAVEADQELEAEAALRAAR